MSAMKKKNNVSKSIPEQIVEEALGVIKKQKIFDDETIEGLEGLWGSGDLKKAERIIRVIKPKSEKLP
jgi:hypothetical protein